MRTDSVHGWPGADRPCPRPAGRGQTLSTGGAVSTGGNPVHGRRARTGPCPRAAGADRTLSTAAGADRTCAHGSIWAGSGHGHALFTGAGNVSCDQVVISCNALRCKQVAADDVLPACFDKMPMDVGACCLHVVDSHVTD